MSTTALSLRGFIDACRGLLRLPIGRAALLLTAIAAGACGSRADADTITAQSFRLEIATNLVWMDNRDDPMVQSLDNQQNFFDRQVINSQP